MPQVTIHVPPRPYQAWIENGLLTRAGSVLGDLLPQASRIFVVTVPPVRTRWGSKLVTFAQEERVRATSDCHA